MSGAAQRLTPAAQPQGPGTRRLRKGELLFSEGENSRAMYFLKSGMIRLYKKKGDSFIELDTVHSGAVLGELAFLDGNPRSASGEALTECELIEISGPTFQNVLAQMPEWLKILLKTVVGRLRTASTRIRQLESASTAIDYSDKEGKRSPSYVFLSMVDVLKISTAVLLVASRNTEDKGQGPELRIGVLQRYANQIMGVPVAKVTTVLDIFAQCGVLSAMDEASGTRFIVKDAAFLEQMIAYFNEENLLEPSKRHDISVRGFFILSLMARHVGRGTKNPEGTITLNLGEIRKLEQTEGGKDPFRLDEFQEIVKLGYATNLNAKSNDEAYTDIHPQNFIQAYKFQRVSLAIRAINEQKSKGGR